MRPGEFLPEHSSASQRRGRTRSRMPPSPHRTRSSRAWAAASRHRPEQVQPRRGPSSTLLPGHSRAPQWHGVVPRSRGHSYQGHCREGRPLNGNARCCPSRAHVEPPRGFEPRTYALRARSDGFRRRRNRCVPTIFSPSKSAEGRPEPRGFSLISVYDFDLESLRNPQNRSRWTVGFRNSTYAPGAG